MWAGVDLPLWCDGGGGAWGREREVYGNRQVEAQVQMRCRLGLWRRGEAKVPKKECVDRTLVVHRTPWGFPEAQVAETAMSGKRKRPFGVS